MNEAMRDCSLRLCDLKKVGHAMYHVIQNQGAVKLARAQDMQQASLQSWGWQESMIWMEWASGF